MTAYRQHCPVATAAEVLGQSWTLLVVRELLHGSSRTSEIAQGVPGMSGALLARRLNQLAVARIDCTVSALASVRLGHRTWREALAERGIRFEGTREAVRNTIGWLGRNRFTDRADHFPQKQSAQATV